MKIIGHGGAAGLAPRNTLAALLKAIEYHVDEVEFDVRVTADHIPIVHHHAEVTDADGNNLLIGAHDYQTLKEHVPDLLTLDAALEGIAAQTIAHLEVKPQEPVAPIARVIQTFLEVGTYKPTDFVLASRSGKTLRQLHQALPELPIAVIEFWSSLRAVYNARSVGTKRIDFLEYWLWSGVIRNLVNHGYSVYSFNSVYPKRVWLMSLLHRSGQTNDPKRLKRWQRAGLTGVITDYPDRFKRA